MAEGKLVHHAYCGMPVPITSSEDIAELRREAAALLRRRRKMFPVTILERGKEWEIESNDDDFMVSDFSGILTLTEPNAADEGLGKCRECGEYLTQDGRLTVYCPSCDVCGECLEFDGHAYGCSAINPDEDEDEE